MEPLLWLDIPLAVFGTVAVLAVSANRFLRRGSPRVKKRRSSWVPALLVFVGLMSLTAACMDVGYSQWEIRARAVPDDGGSPQGFDPFYLMRPFEAGAPAPDFRLPSLEDDRLVSLSDYRGRKPVVLALSSFT